MEYLGLSVIARWVLVAGTPRVRPDAGEGTGAAVLVSDSVENCRWDEPSRRCEVVLGLRHRLVESSTHLRIAQ